jgi:hypothetical protein
VQYLHAGRDKLLTFTNEDVTMGTWMMGVDREMVSFTSITQARLWECGCSKYTRWLRYDNNVYYHNVSVALAAAAALAAPAAECMRVQVSLLAGACVRMHVCARVIAGRVAAPCCCNDHRLVCK